MPIYFVQLIYAFHKFIDDWDDPFAVLILQLVIATALGGVLGFYLSHTRELRRFFLQRTSEKKQDQVMNILNSQSDAILVVEKSTTDYRESNIQMEAQGHTEEGSNLSDTRVEFCNS